MCVCFLCWWEILICMSIKLRLVLNLDSKNVMRENTFRFLSSHMGLWLVKGLEKKHYLVSSILQQWPTFLRIRNQTMIFSRHHISKYHFSNVLGMQFHHILQERGVRVCVVHFYPLIEPTYSKYPQFYNKLVQMWKGWNGELYDLLSRDLCLSLHTSEQTPDSLTMSCHENETRGTWRIHFKCAVKQIRFFCCGMLLDRKKPILVCGQCWVSAFQSTKLNAGSTRLKGYLKWLHTSLIIHEVHLKC